jgi:hypothetical protein
MTTRPLRLSGVTTHDRHAVVAALTEVLNEVGWVVDFKQFSNVALAVQFELSPPSAARLQGLLDRLPLHLSPESLEALTALSSPPPPEGAGDPDPLPGSIHLAFVHSDGELRIPVPAVPG